MSSRAGTASGRAGTPGRASHQDSGAGPASMAGLSPVLTKLVATARADLDSHVGQGGVCGECGLAWPCQTACIAAVTMEAVGDGS